ncbi:MAG: DUF4115 domain-containing protein [Candidatus Omnitrophica bacterium]|nr:DUF4115 domain-containing protein [Candidatus Omnitrophota bacterium]
METAGAKLKKLRLEKGLSLEEVHKKTKIDLRILRSIEEDGFLNLNPVYLRGFIKIYCKFLGLDPKECILDYTQKDSSSVYMPAKPSAKRTSQAFKEPLERFSGFKNKYLKFKSLAVFITAILVLWGFFSLGKSISLRAKESRSKAALLNKNKPEVKPAPTKKQASPTVVSSAIKLVIYAKSNCYVPYLKIDGRTVFQGVIERGRSESWQAKERIDFSLGNAGAVDLEVNGKRIVPLGRKGQAIKNITIDKEGLKIKR